MRNHRAVARRYVLGGFLASIIASVCCVGPFFLLATGLSAAWMGQLMVMETYQLQFSLLAIGAFVIGGGKLYQAVQQQDEPSCCQHDQVVKISESIIIAVLLLISLVLLTSNFWLQFFI